MKHSFLIIQVLVLFQLFQPIRITAQPISPFVYGQNFWESGFVNNNPQSLVDFQWTGATLIRIGGADLNTHSQQTTVPTTLTISNMVLKVKNAGMVPIVQIPLGTKTAPLDVTGVVIPGEETRKWTKSCWGGKQHECYSLHLFIYNRE
jgi:hypothetical protein